MTLSRSRRIWSELFPLRELCSHEILTQLQRRGIQLLAAAQPADLDDALALVSRANEIELEIGLWPLLPDARGRWLHPGNAGEFADWIETLLAAVDERGARIDSMAIDFEPPIDEVKGITEGRLGAARAWLRRPADASEAHRRLMDVIRGRGIEIIAALLPPLLLDGTAGRGWHRALGVPWPEIGCDRANTMLYSTLFEGYSAGVVQRSDARALLSRFAGLALDRFGTRASVSLGCVGPGALGDERTYRDPEELADDVALTLGAGIEDVALFDLAGVLARPPIDRWLDALVSTKPASSRAQPTARASAILAGLSVTGVALDLFGRVRR